MNEPGNVQRMDVVAHLFALVTEHLVHTSLNVAFHQVAEEAVQLHAAVVRPREAAPAQAAGFHAEIAAVLLDHHVCRDLGCSEQGVYGAVDAESLVDSLRESPIGIVPARFLLNKSDLVGRVAVDLVGRHVDEGAVDRVTPDSFKHIECSDRIDVEIVEWPGGGEVVARLGCRVHGERGLQRGDQRVYPATVADVELVMLEPSVGLDEAPLVPTRVPARPEEVGAHVVVHPVDFPVEAAEIFDDLGSDQTGRSGYEGNAFLIDWHSGLKSSERSFSRDLATAVGKSIQLIFSSRFGPGGNPAREYFAHRITELATPVASNSQESTLRAEIDPPREAPCRGVMLSSPISKGHRNPG